VATDDHVASPDAKPAKGDSLSGERTAETQKKLQLITASYAEVLDATKHQDDKIGQLLTGVAFLTAATLALAALEPISIVARRFTAQPFRLPLLLITLAVFLLGIAFGVMLLLISLSTPLRLPGLGRSRADRPEGNTINWINGVRGSQVYFFEIARLSIEQWETKWDASADALARERVSSLIKETHNLGLRTRAKYDRTTEAVALLSMSLLAFALGVILVAIVATGPPGMHPINMTLLQRILLGGIIASYCWIQLLGQIRYSHQAVDEVPPPGMDTMERVKYLGQLLYAATLPLLLVVILEYDRSWPGLTAWLVVTVGLATASVVAFWMATSGQSADRRGNLQLPRWILTGLTVILTAGVILCGVKGWYGWQLAAVSFAVLCLIALSVLQPTMSMRKDRKGYWNPPAASTPGPGQG
jgi:hypothetical protein